MLSKRDGADVNKYEPLVLCGIIVWGNLNAPKNTLTYTEILRKHVGPLYRAVYDKYPAAL